MKKYYFISILLLCTNQLFAQDWYQNYEKYWWYRYRLVNDFMKIGTGPGESIPAMLRFRAFITGQGVLDEGYSKLWWTDQTEILGQNIAMLSAEYRLLQNNGWDTVIISSSTTQEIKKLSIVK